MLSLEIYIIYNYLKLFTHNLSSMYHIIARASSWYLDSASISEEHKLKINSFSWKYMSSDHSKFFTNVITLADYQAYLYQRVVTQKNKIWNEKFYIRSLVHVSAYQENTLDLQHTNYTMCSNSKNIQKLTKIETEMMKNRQTPSTAKNYCEGEVKQASDFKCNDKINVLRTARSSCANDILMKTLIAKYAQRLMDKLSKISINIPDDSEHVNAIVKLCRKAQRLIKNLDQVGGPSDSTTVLLNKYDCLRMEYYSLRDKIKGTNRQQCDKRGVSVATRRSDNCKIYDKIKKCKKVENGKKLEEHKKIHQNCDKINNHRKHELCEYCKNRKRLCGITWETKQRIDKANCRKKPFEWKSFLKHRLFIYFPCLCCMVRKPDWTKCVVGWHLGVDRVSIGWFLSR